MARTISQLGYRVKLIAPQFVRPFVKSNKNDFVDAEVICEVASRPSMRFVTPRQQEIERYRAHARSRLFIALQICAVHFYGRFIQDIGSDR